MLRRNSGGKEGGGPPGEGPVCCSESTGPRRAPIKATGTGKGFSSLFPLQRAPSRLVVNLFVYSRVFTFLPISEALNILRPQKQQ